MSGEKLGGNWIQKTKELASNLNIDPTKTSAVVSGDTMQQVGKNDRNLPIMMDEAGRKFHEIKQSPQDQMFLARLLKGIVPVSDVVYMRDKDKFYSYEVPLDRVSPNGESYDADKTLLGLIFRDTDHEGENVFRTDNTHAFFDFGGFIFFWPNNEIGLAEEISRESEYIDVEERQILVKKLDELAHRLENERGYKFITAIVKNLKKSGAGLPWVIRSKQKTTEDPVQLFQKTVLERIAAVRQGLSRANAGRYEMLP